MKKSQKKREAIQRDQTEELFKSSLDDYERRRKNLDLLHLLACIVESQVDKDDDDLFSSAVAFRTSISDEIQKLIAERIRVLPSFLEVKNAL